MTAADLDALRSALRVAGFEVADGALCVGLGLVIFARPSDPSKDGITNLIAVLHSGHQIVERAESGPDWPLRLDRGTITCRKRPDGRLLLVSAPTGHTYALNELAEQHGYPAVEALGDGYGLGILDDHVVWPMKRRRRRRVPRPSNLYVRAGYLSRMGESRI